MIETSIYDLYLREINAIDQGASQRLMIYQYEDHLLRNLKAVEFVKVSPRSEFEMRVRDVADEVWAMIQGEASFYWQDMRANSPTYKEEFEYLTSSPLVMLVPFGVAFGYRALSQEVSLIRLATHLDHEDQGYRLEKDE